MVSLKEIFAFFCGFVNFFSAVHGFFQQVDVDEEIEVFVELGEAEVGFVHDLGFQCSAFGDFGYFRYYAEFVASFD
jgi:hypothetical protein